MSLIQMALCKEKWAEDGMKKRGKIRKMSVLSVPWRRCEIKKQKIKALHSVDTSAILMIGLGL